ncbi:hypothetical protein COU37_03715 [Candidatus Micrarchaeota archaeon CG10_big_fil_rev_8_21_14_0_10_45_29]|nr:MAG: hypothetical protein COU37_03715 [Candidatus Micrarchaeota archaeon CG10_big_fil_rev_8_21_14_0_10_45_29]
MQARLFSPKTGNKEIIVVKQDTIGSGELGAKTRNLRKFKDLMEKCNFPIVPHVAIAPEVFADFYKKNRCGKEAPITRAEVDAIEEAILPFYEKFNLAIRSDEHVAGGNGIWKSTFVSTSGGSKKDIMRMAVGAAYWILESDFSQDAVAFKQRLGIEKNLGLLIMPEVRDGHIKEKTGKPYEFIRHGYRASIISNFYKYPKGEYGRNKVEIFGKYAGDEREKLKHSTRMRGKIEKGLYLLQHEEKNPLYFELVASPREWNCVQVAKVPGEEIERPRVKEENIFVYAIDGQESQDKAQPYSQRISGNGVAGAESIFVITSDDIFMDEEIAGKINKKNRNYALILEGIGFTSMRIVHRLKKAFEFHNISNAAAIISNVNCGREPYSHFNGAVRDAGIILLASENYNKELLSSLKRGGEENRAKVVVYANEREGEGFAAFEK